MKCCEYGPCTVLSLWIQLTHLALLVRFDVSGFGASFRRHPLEDVAAVVRHVRQDGALLDRVAPEDDLRAAGFNDVKLFTGVSYKCSASLSTLVTML
jgi:hypothetical protein